VSAIGGSIAGSVLQVVSTTKTDTFSTTSSTYNDLTGLSATITPQSTGSKILIMYNYESNATETSNQLMSRLMRDSTPIAVGDSAGSRTPATTGMNGQSTASVMQVNFGQFLDSPGTTSAVTYKIQVRCTVNGQTAYVGRTITDSDTANYSRTPSTITLIEVAG
jgi:hypothetical protein